MGLRKKIRKYFEKEHIGAQQHSDFPLIDGTHYQDVLSKVEEKINPEWYLEVGSRSGDSISKIKCNYLAIDPEFVIKNDVWNSAKFMQFFQMTSDDFFASKYLDKSGIKPDFAFIDGMHLFEYALRDFINCEKHMNKGGMVFFHDVCPFNYLMTTRDTDYVNSGLPWTGDVWKTMAVLVEYRPDLQIDVLTASRTGLGCVRGMDASNTVLSDNYDAIIEKYTSMELEDIGAKEYFDNVPLRDPENFLNSL